MSDRWLEEVGAPQLIAYRPIPSYDGSASIDSRHRTGVNIVIVHVISPSMTS